MADELLIETETGLAPESGLALPNWQQLARQTAALAALLAGLLVFCTCTSQGRAWSGYQPAAAARAGTIAICRPRTDDFVPQRCQVTISNRGGTKIGDRIRIWAISITGKGAWQVGEGVIHGSGGQIAVNCNLDHLRGSVELSGGLWRQGQRICDLSNPVVVLVKDYPAKPEIAVNDRSDGVVSARRSGNPGGG